MNSQKTVAAGWVCGHLSWRPAKDKVVHWEQSGFWALTKSQKYTNKNEETTILFSGAKHKYKLQPNQKPSRPGLLGVRVQARCQPLHDEGQRVLRLVAAWTRGPAAANATGVGRSDGPTVAKWIK